MFTEIILLKFSSHCTECSDISLRLYGLAEWGGGREGERRGGERGRLFLHACMSMYHMGAWYLWRSEEDIGYPGSEIGDVVSHYIDTGNRTKVKNRLPPLQYQLI